jgi:hypothetical protein
VGEKVGNSYSRQSFESLADTFQSVLESGDRDKKTYLVGKKTKDKCEIDGVLRDDITYLSQKNKKHGAAAAVYRLSGRRKADYAGARQFLGELVSYALDERSGLNSDQESAAKNIQDMLSKSRSKSRIVLTGTDKENIQKILDGVKMRTEHSAVAVQEDLRGVDHKLLHFLDDVQEMQRGQKVAPAHVRKPENKELLKEIGRVNHLAKSLNEKLPSAGDKLKFKRRSFTAIAGAGGSKAEEQAVENLLDKIAGWPGSVLQGQLNHLFEGAKSNGDESFRQASKSILLALAEQQSTLKLAHDVLTSDEFLKTVEAEDDRKKLRELGQSAQALVSKFNDHSSPFARLKNLALAGYHWPEDTAKQVVEKRDEFFKSLIPTVPTDIAPGPLSPPPDYPAPPLPGQPNPAASASGPPDYPPPQPPVQLPLNSGSSTLGQLPPAGSASAPVKKSIVSLATAASSTNLQSPASSGNGPNVQPAQPLAGVPPAIHAAAPFNGLPPDDPSLPIAGTASVQSIGNALAAVGGGVSPKLQPAQLSTSNATPPSGLAPDGPSLPLPKPAPGKVLVAKRVAQFSAPTNPAPPLSPVVKASTDHAVPSANVATGDENAELLTAVVAFGADKGASPNVQPVLSNQPEVSNLQSPPENPVATIVASGDSLTPSNGVPPADQTLSQPIAGVVPPPLDLPPVAVWPSGMGPPVDLPPPPDLQPSVAVTLPSNGPLPPPLDLPPVAVWPSGMGPPVDLPPPPQLQPFVAVDVPFTGSLPLADGSVIPGNHQPPAPPPPLIPGNLLQAHKEQLDKISDREIADAVAEMNGKPRVLYTHQKSSHPGLDATDKKDLGGQIGAFGAKVAAKVSAAAKIIEKRLKDFGGGVRASNEVYIKEFEQRLIDNATRNARITLALSDVAASSSENRLLAAEQQKKITLLYEQMLEGATLDPKRAVDKFVITDGGGALKNSGDPYFRRLSNQFNFNLRAFSPELPEIGENLSAEDLRNNKLTNRFIATGKLAEVVESAIPKVFREFGAETQKFIVARPELEFWMVKGFQAQDIFAFMAGTAVKNSMAVENLFQRMGKEGNFQKAAGELVKTIKRQFDMLMFLTQLLTDEEYVKVFPDEIRAAVREYGRSMQQLAIEMLNPDAPFLAVYRLTEAAFIAPSEVMLKLNEATAPLPPTDLPEPLNESGIGGSAPPNKPQPALPTLASTVN